MLVSAYSCSSSNVIIYTTWCSPPVSLHQKLPLTYQQNTPVDLKIALGETYCLIFLGTANLGAFEIKMQLYSP